MLTADYIVAAEGTRFLSAYAKVGLTPDLGVSTLLPAAVGQRSLRTGEAPDPRGGATLTERFDDEARTFAQALSSDAARVRLRAFAEQSAAKGAAASRR